MTDANFADVVFWDLLGAARARGASDLHLAAARAPFVRIDGALSGIETAPPSHDEVEHFVQSLLSGNEVRRFQDRGDIDVALRHEELGRFRVHLYRSQGKTHFAVRLLALKIPLLQELQLPSVISEFATHCSGLILFAGPTGSGKTTALAALVDQINQTQAKHILTVEDPIEYVHRPGKSIFEHREVGQDVPDFECAIREALRLDPDILVIGELRSPPAMAAALTAAETGHLVLSTIHTGDAAQTVDRFVDSFGLGQRAEVRSQLARTLVGIVSVRLVPLARRSGRRAVAEVLAANDAVRSLIRDGKAHQIRNAILTGRDAGMQTLEAHLSSLVAAGEITLRAASAITDRPADLHCIEEA